jgi:hypothetical protein
LSSCVAYQSVLTPLVAQRRVAGMQVPTFGQLLTTDGAGLTLPRSEPPLVRRV